MKMASDNLAAPVNILEHTIPNDFLGAFDRCDVQEATALISKTMSAMDTRIQETVPFKLVKTDKASGTALITELVRALYTIARMLNPILPVTSEKIKILIKENRMPTEPLFRRK